MIITLYSVTVTILVYLMSRIISKKYPSPFTTPVFLSTLVMILFLLLTGTTYEKYEPAKDIMTYLLGPATIALAIPIYKHRNILLKYKFSVGISLCLGSVVTILSTVFMAKLLNIPSTIIASLSVKTATVPIAIEVSNVIRGDKSLTATFVILTGILGGMLGPYFLRKTKITSPFSRGLAIGTVSHGIGTAEIVKEGQIQGAISGIAMGLAAIFISLFVPLIRMFF